MAYLQLDTNEKFRLHIFSAWLKRYEDAGAMMMSGRGENRNVSGFGWGRTNERSRAERPDLERNGSERKKTVAHVVMDSLMMIDEDVASEFESLKTASTIYCVKHEARPSSPKR